MWSNPQQSPPPPLPSCLSSPSRPGLWTPPTPPPSSESSSWTLPPTTALLEHVRDGKKKLSLIFLGFPQFAYVAFFCRCQTYSHSRSSEILNSLHIETISPLTEIQNHFFTTVHCTFFQSRHVKILELKFSSPSSGAHAVQW